MQVNLPYILGLLLGLFVLLYAREYLEKQDLMRLNEERSDDIASLLHAGQATLAELQLLKEAINAQQCTTAKTDTKPGAVPFEIIKNMSPTKKFTWGPPMPLLPSDEAQQFLKKEERSNWLPDHIRRQARYRDKPVRVVVTLRIGCEVDLLELRLMELYDLVDYIVITESNVSTTGTAKRLHFWENRYRYEQYWPKIKYLVEWEGYKRDIVKGDWTNDNMGIRSLYTTLNGLDDDDVVMGGDADEIPSGDALMFWRHFKGFDERSKIHVRWSQMGFFWRVTSTWDVLSISTYRKAKETQAVRYQKSSWTLGSHSVPSGWHCSWCFPYQDFVFKYRNVIEAFWAHGDKLHAFTDEVMEEARYEGTTISSGEVYVYDKENHPAAAWTHFKYFADREVRPKCGWCRQVPEGVEEWPVEDIQHGDPIPEDLIRKASQCSNDITRSSTKVLPASQS